MAYIRKTKTAAELSALRAAAGKKGAATTRARGNFRGGRPRGVKSDTDPMASITAHATDNDFITRMAFLFGLSKSACLRILVCQYRELHDVKMGEECEKRLENSSVEFGKFIKRFKDSPACDDKTSQN